MLRRILSVAVVVLGGCTEGIELPPVERIYESEYIQIDAEPSIVACEGVGPRMDRQARFLDEALGLGPPSSPLPIYWLTEEGLEQSIGCPVACAAGREVYTEWLPYAHELTHAYMADRRGTARISFFEEGLAHVFGGGHAASRGGAGGDLGSVEGRRPKSQLGGTGASGALRAGDVGGVRSGSW